MLNTTGGSSSPFLFGRVVCRCCQAQYVPDNVHQIHVQTAFHVWKTRGCQCSFRLLMMGGVSPETCWASYKYRIIQFWYIVASCRIFLYEFYYDARIHERQTFDWGCMSMWCVVWYVNTCRCGVSPETCWTSYNFFFATLRPNAGHGLLVLDVSRSHTTTHHSR